MYSQGPTLGLEGERPSRVDSGGCPGGVNGWSSDATPEVSDDGNSSDGMDSAASACSAWMAVAVKGGGAALT